jgi:glycosyltransferase involved in cell wall biosynthesis
MFHATAETEAQSIQAILRTLAGGGRWEVEKNHEPKMVVAANGVEIPAGISGREILEKKIPKLKDKKWIVFMSRIHPKKGLLELAKAWMEMRQGDEGWELVIAGPEDDTGYAKRVRAQLRGEGVWTEELAGEEKWCALGNAGFVALPTYSENFGIVVAEALAAGRPVLTTTGTPWGAACVARPREDGISDMGYGKPSFAPNLASSGGAMEGGFAGGSMNLEEKKCGVICELTDLKRGLEKMMGFSDKERCEMGKRGREWMRSDFSWQAGAGRLIAAYKEIG